MHGAKCSKYHISAAVLLETISNILNLDLIHNIHIYRIAYCLRRIDLFQCYE